MALIVDFLLRAEPLSQQSKSRTHRRAWRDYVHRRASQVWLQPPLNFGRLKFTMVYLASKPRPGDINNFVKPIQDALCGLVYVDDAMIVDVSAHIRPADDYAAIDGLPPILASALCACTTGVYVAISESRELTEELT